MMSRPARVQYDLGAGSPREPLVYGNRAEKAASPNVDISRVMRTQIIEKDCICSIFYTSRLIDASSLTIQPNHISPCRESMYSNDNLERPDARCTYGTPTWATHGFAGRNHASHSPRTAAANRVISTGAELLQ